MDKNEIFITKAKVIHGDAYVYNKVNYTTNNVGVIITCKLHGDFTQRPSDHLSGSGCKLCGRKRSEDAKRSDSNSFILKAENVHGKKYDYSKVNYKSATTNVEIICPTHGSFLQLPHNHLSGLGCRKCSIEYSKVSYENFMLRAKEKHGTKYDYSKVVFKDFTTEITIICPQHGEFLQKPKNHILYGCSKCSGVNKKSNDEFIISCKKIHGEIYNYDKVKYDGNKKPVTITCEIHGDFEQTPNAHLNGQGCYMCGREKTINAIKLNTLDFISKANIVHKFFYNYDKVNYVSSENRVTITCPYHGDFNQIATKHLAGKKCPQCSHDEYKEKVKTNKEDFITRAIKVHDKDYSYTKLPDKVKLSDKYDIYCKKCGEYFSQRLSGHLNGNGHKGGHLNGNGHKECSKVYLTNEEYAEKCNKIHNNKYDYSLVNYVGTKYKVLITCPIHGTFMQNAGVHLRGAGCFHCGRIKAIDNTRTPINDYIKKAREVHGEKFDYSLVKFQSVNDEIEIICPVHGLIKQRASGHLKYGCARCHFDSKLLTNEDFIKKSKKHHEETYDYSKTIYNGHRNKVIIICKEHGEFEQLAGEHIRGAGCPICSSSKGEKKINKLLTSLGIDYKSEYKIKDSNYKYDFYIPSGNILIEYDGEQHFKPIDHFGGKAMFEKQIIIDKEKDDLASSNGYLLIRIPYLLFQDLETELIRIISTTYPYRYENKFYKSFIDLTRSLGKSIEKERREDYDVYLTRNLLK